MTDATADKPAESDRTCFVVMPFGRTAEDRRWFNGSGPCLTEFRSINYYVGAD